MGRAGAYLVVYKIGRSQYRHQKYYNPKYEDPKKVPLILGNLYIEGTQSPRDTHALQGWLRDEFTAGETWGTLRPLQETLRPWLEEGKCLYFARV